MAFCVLTLLAQLSAVRCNREKTLHVGAPPLRWKQVSYVPNIWFAWRLRGGQTCVSADLGHYRAWQQSLEDPENVGRCHSTAAPESAIQEVDARESKK